jgi:hypothetical protein
MLLVAGTLQRVVQGTNWPAFHFFQFISNDDGQCLKISLKKDGIYMYIYISLFLIIKLHGKEINIKNTNIFTFVNKTIAT